MTLLLLIACTAGDAADSATPIDDTAAGYDHPIVPEKYRGLWDEDSVSCDDAIFYWAFEGGIDADGAITGEEGWYWFFADEGAATDCSDVFEIEGAEQTEPIFEDPCLSCDRDFTASYNLAETGCNWEGYEGLLDNDSTDRIDEEEYTLAIMHDALDNDSDPLSQMNVWSYAQDDRVATDWNDRAISEGTYTPDGSDTRGAATLSWAIGGGVCVTIE